MTDASVKTYNLPVASLNLTEVLVVVLISTLMVAVTVSWVKVLIFIARSSYGSVFRTLLFVVVLFWGPIMGTLVGWLALRRFPARTT